MSVQELLARDFATVADLIHAQAKERPHELALIDEPRTLDYAALDARMSRIAASLQRDGLQPGDSIAICAANSLDYACVLLGALRAGVAVAPLAPSSTPGSLLAMLEDCGAKLFFLDHAAAHELLPQRERSSATWLSLDPPASRDPRAAADSVAAAIPSYLEWLAVEAARPAPVTVDPTAPFNIIYSSGTTGTPKGIVQPHSMRWAHVRRGGDAGYGPGSVTMVSTPLYSNTTLVSFFPAVALGGAVVLMPKFDARRFLELADKHRATHAMLVPAQYQRIMDLPDFDRFDLSSFRLKFCTSAPFSAELKRRVLDRWPGGLVEYYGMTEGGGTCVLQAHKFPDKLHTVGRPAPGHDIRVIDDAGHELPAGQLGEVVGRSSAMMSGYHNQSAKTRESEWYDASGQRFIRTGDIGRFDEDGFLTLVDRKKDMIISGGFNIYPSDLEAVLLQHPAVLEASVIGVPSTEWGETPVAFVVLAPGASATPADLQAWFKERVGKTQRLHAVQLIDQLPRSAIGKVLKRELRDRYVQV